MRRIMQWTCAGLLLALLLPMGAALADDDQTLKIGGTLYTKFLWGTQRVDGGLYNFTTIPGEGYGDNGQGSEVELLLSARVSKYVEVTGRLKGRFNQNLWTNFGGFGNPAGADPGDPECIGGDCGEFDPRSAQYVKLRGMAVRITPGYSWIDSATIGSNDFGMFDPFVIGRIRYIDRDNASGMLFQGSSPNRMFSYDVVRISLPRLWAGPNFETGSFTGSDAAYGAQFNFNINPKLDFGIITQYVNDIEVDNRTFDDFDDGAELRTRFRNYVWGGKVGIHPHRIVDIRAAYYTSTTDSADDLESVPENFFGLSGFSPLPAGKLDGDIWKVNIDLNDPFDVGLNFAIEGFSIDEQYVSMMAARRESDVLLTEGHDGAWAFPGPSNASFGVFAGNPTRIGYGGWDGEAQQVPTINVDNEFTDFEEPMAETVIGWKGITFKPSFGRGAFDVSFEYTYLDYNTNWQAFGMEDKPVDSTIYPVHELDSGVGHNFRSAYAPFQEKETTIAVLKARYVIDAGRGIDVFGKLKVIDEEDDRLDDPRFLPYQPGDCDFESVSCAGEQLFYGTDPTTGNQLSTSSIYFNPPAVTDDEGDPIGFQWKPFDSIDDDDRDLDYTLVQLGLGYQVHDDLYLRGTYERYDVELLDGNTAFQAYNLHEMASGDHIKNRFLLNARYILAGMEIGLEYQYNWGDFEPDFGGGFVPTVADEATSADHGVPVGSLGFRNRFGGWNSLEKRDFEHSRVKAFLKVQF